MMMMMLGFARLTDEEGMVKNVERISNITPACCSKDKKKNKNQKPYSIIRMWIWKVSSHVGHKEFTYHLKFFKDRNTWSSRY